VLVVACAAASARAGTLPGTSQAQPAETPLLPADAKAVLGDWTIAASGQNGPVTMLLTLKVQDDKVVGDISSDQMPASHVTSVTRAGSAVILRYSFDYQGNGVATVITLTPDGDKLQVTFDFANGAYTMPGTATRKKTI
jgi:hypothetical protein